MRRSRNVVTISRDGRNRMRWSWRDLVQRALERLKRDVSRLADSIAKTAIAAIASPMILTALMVPSSLVVWRET
jgi:hypothetical protein